MHNFGYLLAAGTLQAGVVYGQERVALMGVQGRKVSGGMYFGHVPDVFIGVYGCACTRCIV